MEYTKGEWNKEGNKVKVHGRGIIAICPSPTDGHGVLEFVANAHLIAAAPKMCEALKGLIAELKLHTTKWDLGMLQLISNSEQAIAEVEGKSG